MEERYSEFISYIARHPKVGLSDLVKRFGVSERTVYNRIARANELLGDSAHIERNDRGFELAVRDQDAFAACCPSHLREAETTLPSTPEERVEFLLDDLLARNDWVTLNALSSILYVSRVSISKDLKKVEKILGEHGLALERKPHYGVRVSGPEINRRVCMAKLVLDKPCGQAAVDSGAGSKLPPLREISGCVTDILHREKIQIDGSSFHNLLVHLAIALMRIRENCYVPLDAENLDAIDGTREYAAAEQIAHAIERHFHVRLPHEEIAYIAIHLAGKQTLDSLSRQSRENSLVISDDLWAVVIRMLNRINEIYCLDFRDDIELGMNLARHIGPLTVRLKYRMNLENPLLADIKTRFPLAYSMAADASSVLTEEYGAKPSDDEIGYIALSFALALEHAKTQVPKKNILVVCASGNGSAKLLEYRYRQQFGDKLGRIEVCNASRLNEVDFSDIDYVFTTVPIAQELPVPVRKVQFFLDEREIKALNGIFDESGMTLSCFDERLFYPHLTYATKDAALENICRRISQVERIPDNFFDLILERERVAPTAFGNMVAIPHPMEAVSERTFVAVGLFDRPITWNGESVQAIFLVSIARARDIDLNSFYHSLLRVLMNGSAVKRLLEDRRLETLVDLISNGTSEVERSEGL